MLLFTHVIIALLTILSSVGVMVLPSKRSIFATKSLTLATIASGSALVVLTSAQIISSCISGLAVVSISLASIKIASLRLAKQKI